jgi:hypothetical protein
MGEGQGMLHCKTRRAHREKGAFFAAFAVELVDKLGNPSSVF